MRDLQKEIADWATYNFGANPVWQPTLGLTEECAEFFAAEEKYHVSAGWARTTAQEAMVKMADAIGDGAIYSFNICDKVGLRFIDLFNQIVAAQGVVPVTDRELFGGVGLLSQAVLKNGQGIRKMNLPKLRERVAMGVSVWIRWALWKCSQWGQSFEEVVERTWAEVSKRDWVKNPDGPSAPEEQSSGMG